MEIGEWVTLEKGKNKEEEDCQKEDRHALSLTQRQENAVTWLVWTESTASVVVGCWL